MTKKMQNPGRGRGEAAPKQHRVLKCQKEEIKDVSFSFAAFCNIHHYEISNKTTKNACFRRFFFGFLFPGRRGVVRNLAV